MLGYAQLYDRLARSSARSWLDTLPATLDAASNPVSHGNLARWQALVARLPDLTPSTVDLSNSVTIGRPQDTSVETREQLIRSLKQLHPWRKGPFHLFGIHIDTEWRSDWKWERVRPHVQPLAGRAVLDVGCGNGYYALRMLGAGADLVVGLDPAWLFVMQFAAIYRYLPSPDAYVLPLGIKQLPARLQAFDTVFSMGVLYHRRSPLEHLTLLRNTLKPGGELVLETLVLDVEDDRELIPEKRYAQMRNVWSIPSCLRLESWLAQTGFDNIRIVDVTATTINEQRSTEWMTFHSLRDFLDPIDPSKTVEGYPGPVRAVAIARAPG